MSQERARDVHVSRDRCPFCHDEVRPEHEKVACDGCMAWQHGDCWEAHGTCASCGSRAPAVRPRSPALAKQGALEKEGAAGLAGARCSRPGCQLAARPRYRTCAGHDSRAGASLFLGLGLANLALFLGLYWALAGRGGEDDLMLLFALLFGAPSTLLGAARHLKAYREERRPPT